MFKMIVTDAVVSKGFEGAPALRFYDPTEGGGSSSVRFRIGKRVYDSRCDGNHRYVNIGVKAFGEACERIKKMKLKEGSYINIIGRYDEDNWTDQTTHEKKSAPVLIVDEIEYCYSGTGQKSGQEGAAAGAPGDPAPEEPPVGQAPDGTSPAGQPAAPASPEGAMPQNFAQFQSFGAENPYF